MHRILATLGLAAALLATAPLVVTEVAHAGPSNQASKKPTVSPEKRQAALRSATGKDDKLKGKEVDAFASKHPGMYEDLMKFCETATVRPKAHGVDFGDKKAKKFKCSEKRVDGPYLSAWAKRG